MILLKFPKRVSLPKNKAKGQINKSTSTCKQKTFLQDKRSSKHKNVSRKQAPPQGQRIKIKRNKDLAPLKGQKIKNKTRVNFYRDSCSLYIPYCYSIKIKAKSNVQNCKQEISRKCTVLY